jgi:hypothetical protein
MLSVPELFTDNCSAYFENSFVFTETIASWVVLESVPRALSQSLLTIITERHHKSLDSLINLFHLKLADSSRLFNIQFMMQNQK